MAELSNVTEVYTKQNAGVVIRVDVSEMLYKFSLTHFIMYIEPL